MLPSAARRPFTLLHNDMLQGAAGQFFCEDEDTSATSAEGDDECVFRDDTLVLLEMTTRDMMEVRRAFQVCTMWPCGMCISRHPDLGCCTGPSVPCLPVCRQAICSIGQATKAFRCVLTAELLERAWPWTLQHTTASCAGGGFRFTH